MYFVQKFAGHFLVQNTFHCKMTSYGLKGAHNTYFETSTSMWLLLRLTPHTGPPCQGDFRQKKKKRRRKKITTVGRFGAKLSLLEDRRRLNRWT